MKEIKKAAKSLKNLAKSMNELGELSNEAKKSIKILTKVGNIAFKFCFSTKRMKSTQLEKKYFTVKEFNQLINHR